MSELRAQKLSDDSLEAVTGGTNKEMLELQKVLKTDNIAGIKKGLKEKGITVSLSTREDNKYTETGTTHNLTHDEVMSILQGKK